MPIMRFTLAQIEAFSRIVETGTFNGAARQLHLTQPTVSQRIRELESALGVELFLRHGSRFKLTAEGHALMDCARRLLGTAGEITARFIGEEALGGAVRLGVPNLFAMLCMTDLLRALEQQFPSIKASVLVNDSPTLARLLDDQELDIAILVEPSVGERVRRQPIGRTEYGWMASSRQRLPKPLKPADLADMHLMLSPPPSRLHSMVMGWFSDAEATPTRVSTCNNFALTIETIASGLAVGALPIGVMQLDSAKGRIRRLQVAPALPSDLTAICYQTGTRGSGVARVVELMRELVTQRRLYDEPVVQRLAKRSRR